MSSVKDNVNQAPVRVLLVEDSVPIRQRVRRLIEESGHGTVVGEAGSVATALALFREHHPEAVVLDLNLTEGSGYSVLEEIKNTRPECEVIVLTNYLMPEFQERCRILGADHFFEKSRDFERVPGVLAAIRRSAQGGGRVLVADDEILVGNVLKQFLHAAGYDCEWVPDAKEALQALGRSRFDLLIADINMPGNRQLELLQELPRVAPGLPAILLTGDPGVPSAQAAVRLNARAYLSKPPDLAELKKLVGESIANYRVFKSVRRKWDHIQSLSREVNYQLAIAQKNDSEATELTDLSRLFAALNDVIRVGGLTLAPDQTRVAQHLELVTAIRETVNVLAKTRQSFKSKQLGNLRIRLETLLAGFELQHSPNSPASQAPTATASAVAGAAFAH